MPKKKYPNTRKHIQECAIQLFKEHGYENVTIMQICEHAGITKRTFYYHFPSKSGVVFEYKNYLYKQAEGTVVDMLADQRSYVDILWALLNTFSVYREQGIDILRQIYTHTLSGNSEDEIDFPYSSYSYNTIVKTIANAQQAGEIRNNRSSKLIGSREYEDSHNEHACKNIDSSTCSRNDKALPNGLFIKGIFRLILLVLAVHTHKASYGECAESIASSALF
jgi:AcrR family transcriptional regulator